MGLLAIENLGREDATFRKNQVSDLLRVAAETFKNATHRDPAWIPPAIAR